MTTNNAFMQLPLESYEENSCTPPPPEGLKQYICIAMPTEVDSHPGKSYSTGFHSTPHIIPLCMRYNVSYTHELEELTFTLRDTRTGHLFIGAFVNHDPSPVCIQQPPPPMEGITYPLQPYTQEIPRELIYTLNVAYYVDLPIHSAVYDVTASSRDIVSNVCRVALVRHG